MSYLNYRIGPWNFRLNLLATSEIDREVVNTDDDTTYLYTKWRFDVVAQLNVAFDNAVWFQTGPDGAAVVIGPGRSTDSSVTPSCRSGGS